MRTVSTREYLFIDMAWAHRTIWLLLIVSTMTITLSPAASSQDDGGERTQPGESTAKSQTPAEEEEAEEEEDRWFAITGATAHTVSGPILEDVIILCKNGRIVEIARYIDIPENTEIIDATGFQVYPGLVAVRTSGIVGGGNPADSTDVFQLNLDLALAGGITTAVTGNRAAKLTWGTTEDILLAGSLFETISYSTRSPNARRRLRTDLDRVRAYIRELELYTQNKANDPNLKEPDKKWIKGNFAKYMRLMKKEAVALVDANTSHEILQLCDLANTYGIRFVVRGAFEGWIVAANMARADMAVIMTPRVRVDRNKNLFRPNGSTIENARILRDHGVPVTFIPVGSLFGPGYMISLGGLAGRDLQHLPMEAAFAVRGGMTNADAIRAITLDAARILGVDHRVGSIEVGKDADFVITNGDLLHYTTQPRWTIVNGRVAYDKAADTLFSHIRPDGDEGAPPPSDYWPRRLGAPWINGD